MLEVALGRHSADTALAQWCIWSIRAFVVPGGALWRRRPRRPAGSRRALRGGMICGGAGD
jgi:hypothetical protein